NGSTGPLASSRVIYRLHNKQIIIADIDAMAITGPVRKAAVPGDETRYPETGLGTTTAL
ncbi:hypothetical protein SK128_025977, partial [Halocaridina rubra]